MDIICEGCVGTGNEINQQTYLHSSQHAFQTAGILIMFVHFKLHNEKIIFNTASFTLKTALSRFLVLRHRSTIARKHLPVFRLML